MRSSKRNKPFFIFSLATFFLCELICVASAVTFSTSDEAVFSPMSIEMVRSMRDLRQGTFGAPYFIAYRLVKRQGYDISASFGGVLSESSYNTQILFTEVRYGDRHLDNTSIQYKGWHSVSPIKGKELRENLWILTDKAYKDAVAGYLEKKAKRVTEFRKEDLPDFTVETSTQFVETELSPRFDHQKAREIVKQLSLLLRNYPYIYHGTISLHLKWSRRYLLTSEGTQIATPYQNLPSALSVELVSRAKDGLRVENYRAWVFRDLSDIPSMKDLEVAINQEALELNRLRKAPLQSPMTAPAILDPEMTGVLFHEALGHKLEGERQRDPEQGQIFKGMIGKKIIPSFLSVIDDPTMAFFKKNPLHGHYLIDDEGVPAQRVVLVDHGILKKFLMSRWPLKNFPHSNGHGRADPDLRPLGRMGNLMVEAQNPVSEKSLEKHLLKLILREHKPYGFLIVGAFGGDNPTDRSQAQTLQLKPLLVYRISAKNGEKTLVRGVKIVVTPLVALNRIVAASDDETLSNPYFCGAESGWVPVDQIAPSVLVSEIELERLPEDRLRLPILPSPFSPSVTPAIRKPGSILHAGLDSGFRQNDGAKSYDDLRK